MTDKVRVAEKFLLPNCIIKALWHNEDLSITNTLRRISVFGFFMMYINAIEKN